MLGEELIQALRTGNRVYGTLLTQNSPHWMSMIPTLGLDFVFIDTEHVPIDREKLSWMCQAYTAAHLSPIVRIPDPDPYKACIVLDGGAVGVVAPYVETVDEVQKLVGAVKYRPLKGQRLETVLHNRDALEPDLKHYISEYNKQHVLIINIESLPGVEALDDLLQIKELDGILIGPHDLSNSLGIPEQYGHKTFRNTVDTIIQTVRSSNKGVGIHVTFPNSLEEEIRWAKLGANLIVHQGDILLFQQTWLSNLKQMKNRLGEQVDKSTTRTVNI